MPHYIFESSKASFDDDTAGGLLLDHSPFFYHVIKDHHINFESKEQLRHLWDSVFRLKLHDVTLANWISWRHFDLWTVVPNVSWCPYPFVQILVVVKEKSYTIYPKDVFDTDGIKNYIDELNQNMPEEAQITFNDNEIHVPFDEIIIELLWKDIK